VCVESVLAWNRQRYRTIELKVATLIRVIRIRQNESENFRVRERVIQTFLRNAVVDSYHR